MDTFTCEPYHPPGCSARLGTLSAKLPPHYKRRPAARRPKPKTLPTPALRAAPAPAGVEVAASGVDDVLLVSSSVVVAVALLHSAVNDVPFLEVVGAWSAIS